MEKYLNSALMETDFDGSQTIAEQPIKLSHFTTNLTERALKFIDVSHDLSQDDGKPFVLYYAFPNVHTPLEPSKKFRRKTRHGRYGER